MSRAPSPGKVTQVTLTPEQIATKVSFEEVIRGCSGYQGAEASTRVTDTQLQRYCNHSDASFPPLDVVTDLEKLARNRPGWPHVTRKLASDLGFTLIERPKVDADDCSTLHAALRTSMDKNNRLHVGLIEALGDMKVTGDEARNLLSAALESAEESLRIHAILKRIAEEC